MYSRHSGGFLDSSALSRMLLALGLQLPHFVFIFCTKNRSTLAPMSGSHFAINDGTAFFSCVRYHSSTIASFFSSLVPGRTRRIILLCLSSTAGADSFSVICRRYRFPQT